MFISHSFWYISRIPASDYRYCSTGAGQGAFSVRQNTLAQSRSGELDCASEAIKVAQCPLSPHPPFGRLNREENKGKYGQCPLQIGCAEEGMIFVVIGVAQSPPFSSPYPWQTKSGRIYRKSGSEKREILQTEEQNQEGFSISLLWTGTAGYVPVWNLKYSML